MPTADSYERMASRRSRPAPLSPFRKPSVATFSRSTAPIARSAGSAPSPTPTAPRIYGPGGGGGGYDGGGGAPMVAPAPRPRMSLKDYVNQNYSYIAEREAGERALKDFDAETILRRKETEEDQARQEADLTEDLTEASTSSAEDLASRGLLRSGGAILAQDKIDQQGVRRRGEIQDLLTSFLRNRGSERTRAEAMNREKLNQRIAELTNQYNTSEVGYL